MQYHGWVFEGVPHVPRVEQDLGVGVSVGSVPRSPEQAQRGLTSSPLSLGPDKCDLLACHLTTDARGALTVSGVRRAGTSGLEPTFRADSDQSNSE